MKKTYILETKIVKQLEKIYGAEIEVVQPGDDWSLILLTDGQVEELNALEIFPCFVNNQ